MKSIDRMTVLVLGFSLLPVLLIALLVNSQWRSQAQLAKQHTLFLSQRDGVFAEITNRDFLTENQDAFESVIGSYAVGAKQRREWVEWLDAAKTDLNLPGVEFDIYPLVELVSDDVINIGQETINLRLGLLHEGELLELISYLRRNVRYPFEIISLEVKRDVVKKDNGITSPQESNLSVSFNIRWYSINTIGEEIEAS